MENYSQSNTTQTKIESSSIDLLVAAAAVIKIRCVQYRPTN